MTSKTVKKRIEEEEDFIYCPRLNNSLKKLISKNPEGVSDERICKVMIIEQEELDEIYESALQKFRKALGMEKEE